MKTKAHNFEQDYIKAIKRSARKDYGFQQVRIVRNKKKYDRNRRKMEFLKEYSKTPFSFIKYLKFINYV